MNEVQKMAVEAALMKMARSRYFDICTIDKCLKLAEIPQGGPAYDVLSALHCVDYSDMRAELREALPGLLTEVFSGTPVNFTLPAAETRSDSKIEIVSVSEPQNPAGKFLRLLGR